MRCLRQILLSLGTIATFLVAAGAGFKNGPFWLPQ